MNPIHDDAIEFRDLRYFAACCEEGSLTAAATVITLPVMVLTLLIQRHIVAGLAVGGVKG